MGNICSSAKEVDPTSVNGYILQQQKSKNNELDLSESGLQQYDFFQSKLESVPEKIFKWDMLTKLSIKSQAVEDIPPCISHLSSLESLDLSENEIVVLPAEICSLEKLTLLDVSENQLKVKYIYSRYIISVRTVKTNHMFPF
jgi:Leucine-rich repeat (LRR) protein